MKLIILSSLLYGVLSHKLGVLITCMEQNDESPLGYKDPLYNDYNSSTCEEAPDLCKVYQEVDPYKGKGDVCDHTDPYTGNVRNCCYFNTIYGAVENEEKTWSYKCWYIENCPLKGPDGKGRTGCRVSNKRINCCCQEDYCNGDDLIKQFAQWGRADKYPPNFDEICDYDFGDWYVEFTVPGYEHCGNDPDAPKIGSTEYSEESAESEESPESPESPESLESFESTVEASYDYGAHAGPMSHIYNMESMPTNTTNEVVNVADILLIFSYFVIGVLCLGVGVYIGSKWKTNVLQQQQMLKAQQIDDV